MTAVLLAAVDHDTREVLVGVIVPLIAAVIAWLAFHLMAPAYEAIAALVTFLVVLVAVFLL